MHEVSRVGKVTVVELQTHSTLVPVAIDVVDALGVEARRPPDDAVHLVPLTGKTSKSKWSIASEEERGKEKGLSLIHI